MDYLIRLVQAHETFRKPELEALATLENVRVEIVSYRPESPFCIVRLHTAVATTTTTTTIATTEDQRLLSDTTARSFISRSILSRGIYELWGRGTTYESLHDDVRTRSSGSWLQYEQSAFKFSVDAFCGKRSSAEQRDIINSFRYLGFQGRISMKNPDVEFVVFEEWDEVMSQAYHQTMKSTDTVARTVGRRPKQLFFGRYLGGSRRHLVEKHDLKKRPYISTTSMDAELALQTALLALASPGKLFLDPFVGTGGFLVAAAELGAMTFGADIDGRSYRGKSAGLENGVGANFGKYGLQALFGDCFTSDLTNTPLRVQGGKPEAGKRWLDGIISDPPYGVREGVKVLGTRQSKTPALAATNGQLADALSDPVSPAQQPYYIDDVLAHTLPGYIAPKRPYSFTRMLDDILEFAARTLVDGGRLAFWMPSANELDQELALPTHPLLEMKHVCIQTFNKWSRRLLVYERIKGNVTEKTAAILNGNALKKLDLGSSADELNPFRKMYFKGFQFEQPKS